MSRPESFGRFEVERELGRGAMGVVWLARDPMLERPVAVKAIQVHAGLSAPAVEELRQRFVNEARSAANLSHPSIVTVYEAGSEGDSLYIAMEYVEGESLEDVIESERVLTYKEVADLVIQLGSALDHAHDAGVVHRDIKPGNVLIDRNGRPKIADFGVARQATSTLTATGTIIGTPAYMSPEQITGHSVTGASDQFALAILVYEMLTGRKPFSGEGATTVLYRIVHEAPAAPRDVQKNLPPALDAAVMRALAKDPAERFENCSAFARALREGLRAAPLEAPAAVGSVAEQRSAVAPAPTRVDDDMATSMAGLDAADEPSTLRPWLLPGALAAGALLILVAGALWLSGDGATDPAATVVDGAPENGAAVAPADEEPVVETFRIESRPPGARATLDGRVLEGTTPLTVAVDPASRHTLLLEMEGYEGVSWAFVPEELPASQRAGGRLFFPLRERATTVADGGEETTADGGEDAADDEEDLEPLDPVEVRGNIEAPRRISGELPLYPQWAVDEGLAVSYVQLTLVIDRQGRVRDLRVMNPVHPDLERLAMEAARDWRYEPATRGGEPVDVYHNVAVAFEREEGAERP